jgi:hypothetical protein
VVDAEVDAKVQARHDHRCNQHYLPPVDPVEESHGERL